MNDICIGLFGTCGGSKWRVPFETKYAELGIVSFDPVKENWTPDDAQIEAEHLANDNIVLFPVTSETYGLGSLAETGFSILSAARIDKQRFIIVMIDKDVDQKLKEENPLTATESIRSRALVRAHLTKVKYPNVYIVNTLDEMLEASIVVHDALLKLKQIERFK